MRLASSLGPATHVLEQRETLLDIPASSSGRRWISSISQPFTAPSHGAGWVLIWLRGHADTARPRQFLVSHFLGCDGQALIVEQGHMRFELAQAFGWRLPPKGQVGSAMVVFVFPLAQLLGELGRAAEDHAAVELVGIRPVAPLHLPVAFRTTSRNLAVGDADIPQVPREVSAELGAMVGLNPLDRDGKSEANLLDELGRRLDGDMGVDAEHAIAGGFVNRRELVEPATAELEVFDVDLHRLPRDVNFPTAPWPWMVTVSATPWGRDVAS
jgi:hypothetical protein